MNPLPTQPTAQLQSGHLCQPVTLSGEHVVLAPLSAAHHDDLVAAAQDGELWRLWYTAIAAPEGMASEIQRRLDLQNQGSMPTARPVLFSSTANASIEPWFCKSRRR